MRRLSDYLTAPIIAGAEVLIDKIFQQYAHQRSAESYHLHKMATLQAAWTSAEYYAANLLRAQHFASRAELLADAARRCTVKGLWLEFGVATGETLKVIASVTSEKVYGFDCFEGLPEDWRHGYQQGQFAQQAPSIPSNAELVIGLFESSLPPFAAEHADPVAFLHVDSDLYSSARTIFQCLGERIVPGTIIVFDEYLNFPGWQMHEYKAFQEFVADRSIEYSYISVVPAHQQVCVRIDSVGRQCS